MNDAQFNGNKISLLQIHTVTAQDYNENNTSNDEQQSYLTSLRCILLFVPALANIEANNLHTIEPLFLILHCLL